MSDIFRDLANWLPELYVILLNDVQFQRVTERWLRTYGDVMKVLNFLLTNCGEFTQ